jgi:polyisoprenoid-binding protein YceI
VRRRRPGRRRGLRGRLTPTAAGTIDREDWGLTWNLPLDGGGLVVSKEIRIEIELEAVLQP